MSEWTNAWLGSLATRLDAVNAELRGWPDAYSEAALTRKPKPGGWSAVDCADHVAITATKYLRKATPALEASSTARITHCTMRHSLMGRLEMLVLNPKGGIKMKAPGSLAPQQGVGLAAIEHCVAVHQELLQLMTKADGRDLNQIRFYNPIVPVFRMNLGETFYILTLHAERHMAQARRALEVE